MPNPSIVAVAGPSGSGKTTWIRHQFQDQCCPLYYLCLGLGEVPVDVARVGYTYPWVQVVPEQQIPLLLTTLPEEAVVYLELGFHVDLHTPLLAALPCHRVAVLPVNAPASDWQNWADEIIPGHAAVCENLVVPSASHSPQLWHTALTGHVFDPASLDEVLLELTEGAYGEVHRLKGIFEIPDGRAFYIDFVQGLEGIEYTELKVPRWLEGRPQRPSSLEVVGWGLQQAAIAQTLLDSCLSDSAIAYYQGQCQSLDDDASHTHPTPVDPTHPEQEVLVP